MKYSRHARIIELIESQVIETQEELAEKLKDLGFEVTQATVSRDIKELKLIKIVYENGKTGYATLNRELPTISNKLLTIFSKAFVSSENAGNLVVVKTLSGMAGAVAESIDALNLPETLGSIAGDNTIMIVCRNEKMAESIVNKFNNLAE